MDNVQTKELLKILKKIADKQLDKIDLQKFKEDTKQTNKYYTVLDTLVNSIKNLQESEMRYRSVIDTALDAIIVIDKKGKICSCNQATIRMLGYEESEMLGKNVSMLMPKSIAEEHDKYIANHLLTNKNKVIGIGREVVGKKKNGKNIDLFLSISKLNIQGEIYFAGILHDLTQKKMAVEKLALSEAKNKAILDTAVDAIIVINEKGIIQSANYATKKLFGYNPDYLYGKNISILMPESIRKEHDSYLMNYLKTGQRKVIGIGREVVALRQDGTPFDAHLSISEVKIAGEHLFAGMVRDISQQKQQALELAKLNKNLQIQFRQKDMLNQLHNNLKGELTLEQLGEKLFSFLSSIFPILLGACYSRNENRFKLIASYALNKAQLSTRKECLIDAGLIGQVVKQKKIYIDNYNEDYDLWGESIYGLFKPQQIILMPINNQEDTVGFIELGMRMTVDEMQIKFLKELINIAGINLASTQSRKSLEELLMKTKAQEDELRIANDELCKTNKILAERSKALEISKENLRIQGEEIKQQKTEIEEKAHSLMQSNRYKSEFLANMSHELRTPLNSLLLLSEGLLKNRQNNLTEDELEDISIIKKSGETLLSLISDILDLSKVEAGKLEILTENIYLIDIINNLYSQFCPISKSKNLNFIIENNVPENFRIFSDQMRIEQILSNLLSNAFKFTKKGQVKIIINLVDENSFIQFIVEDSGIGIPIDKHDDIFDAFQQVDGSTARQYGGTGLGLTICIKLTKLLNGYLKLLHSEIDKGSCFELLLPCNLPLTNSKVDLAPGEINFVRDNSSNNFNSMKKIVTSQSIVKHDSLKKIKVMIVDDDLRNSFALSKQLRKEGINVVVADNGKLALEKLSKEQTVDLILMDIMMPEMDGYEIMRYIRAHSEWHSIPMIALTAKAMVGDRQKCLEAGANDYLAKPINVDNLLNVMQKWIRY
ncbi:MAG: hypothetical protein Tsb005_08530 [Gammaproteobacteria bacterium]